MKKNKIALFKHRAAVSAAAGLTALGILLGGLFDSPAHLLVEEPVSAQYSDVLLQENPTLETDEGENYTDYEKKRKGVFRKLRAWILSLPIFVRAGIGLPLWFGGWLILQSLTLLWEPVLSPLLAAVIHCVCLTAILLFALFSAVKAAFPDFPIRKILNRRSLGVAFFGSLLLDILGFLMQIFLPENSKFFPVVEASLLLLILIVAAVPILHHARSTAVQNTSHTNDILTERKMILDLADKAGTL